METCHTLHILWLKGLSYVEGRGFGTKRFKTRWPRIWTNNEKELQAQEMRLLLRRPRFEEKKYKKENKIQHHFLDYAAKKTKRKRCACSSASGASKGIVAKASGSRTPLFFRGGGCRMIEYVE